MSTKADNSILNHAEIQRRRERLAITQEEAAARSGFKSRQQWNEIEAGRQPSITLSTLAKMAEALECEPRDLILRPAAAAKRKERAQRRKPVTA